MNSDAVLIDSATAGNTAAFGTLVRKYQDRLYNTMLHVTGGPEEAEDVVQEAFVQAFLKLASFQKKSAFYTWLYRIAFNVSISRRRRRRPQASVDQHRSETGDEPADPGDLPDNELMRQEQIELVREAIGQLSDEHRTVLVLREMEGCCYETISEILDLPVGTVRSRLHRARLQLKEQLKEVLEEKLID